MRLTYKRRVNDSSALNIVCRTPLTRRYGKSLKIELTGGVDNRDAFGNIIEMPGTPDPQSAAGKKTGQRTLGLMEVEIYQPTTTASTLASRF